MVSEIMEIAGNGAEDDLKLTTIRFNYSDASGETNRQKTQTVAEALRMYKPGVIYSLIFSAAIIMEG